MKIKYIGPSFGVDSLTNGKTCEAIEEVCIELLTIAARTTFTQRKTPHRLTVAPPAANGLLLNSNPS